MKAGRLRHRFAIQLPQQTAQGATGEPTQRTGDDPWKTIATRWGSLEALTGQEAMLAGQVTGQAQHKIGIRFFEGLTTKHRLVKDDRVFNIVSLRNVWDLDKDTEILCWEEV